MSHRGTTLCTPPACTQPCPWSSIPTLAEGGPGRTHDSEKKAPASFFPASGGLVAFGSSPDAACFFPQSIYSLSGVRLCTWPRVVPTVLFSPTQVSHSSQNGRVFCPRSFCNPPVQAESHRGFINTPVLQGFLFVWGLCLLL